MVKKIVKKKVLVALSGGVDSSVAAALLVSSKKYDVTAAFMVNYDGTTPRGESCYLPDYRDAMRVAAKLNIPILKLDFVKEYEAKVLSYMFSEYEKGRTPNPDVMCNSFIKFGSWLRKAHELGFDFMATGHYAKLKSNKGEPVLMAAKDENKDQTYFLHQLTSEQLSHVLFPLGNLTKDKVRDLARKFDLPTAEKEESMGICFIGEVPMKEFLQKRIQPQQGNIVLAGKIIGVHDGLSFYTIGERHLGIKTEQNEPLYVVAKNSEKNELVVGFEKDEALFQKECSLERVNWIRREPKFPLQCEVRLRHRQPLQRCEVEKKEGVTIVQFNKAQRAVTPGQFAVFYKNGECLGGGAVK
jgi:tRNA-specific 2-thiouridylase